MKLGVSGDELIEVFPDKIIKICQDTLKRGGRVFIITELSLEDSRKKMLKLMSERLIAKPFWNQIYSISDWAKQRNIPHWFDIENKFNFLRDKDLHITKSNIAKEIGLDLHIDNSEESAIYFAPSVYCLMLTKEKKCLSN